MNNKIRVENVINSGQLSRSMMGIFPFYCILSILEIIKQNLKILDRAAVGAQEHLFCLTSGRDCLQLPALLKNVINMNLIFHFYLFRGTPFCYQLASELFNPLCKTEAIIEHH